MKTSVLRLSARRFTSKWHLALLCGVAALAFYSVPTIASAADDQELGNVPVVVTSGFSAEGTAILVTLALVGLFVGVERGSCWLLRARQR